MENCGYNSTEASQVFLTACYSNVTSRLQDLIDYNIFDIEQLVVTYEEELPLVLAAKEGSLPVLKMLLDRGADPNVSNGDALFHAFCWSDMSMVRLLLDHGTEISIKGFSSAICGQSLDILKCVLVHESQRAESPDVDVNERIFGRYARLCLAIIECDKTQITRLITEDDRFERAFDNEDEIGMNYQSGRLKIVDESTEMEITVDDNPLHVACRFRQLEAVKFLVQEHKMRLDEQNSDGKTPLYQIRNSGFLRSVLSIFPETDLNLKNKYGYNDLLGRKRGKCTIYSVLLEHGAHSEKIRSEENLNCEHKIYYHKGGHVDCQGMYYLRRLWFIDEEYVKRIALKWSGQELYQNLIKNFNIQEPKQEIEKMKAIKISQGTTYNSAKSLYDVIFFGASEAARYSKNKLFQQIYQENEQDFCKTFPQYGFILNYQLRRGEVRRERQDAAFEFLSEAIGTGMPAAFAELIFGYFTNQALVQYTSEVES